MEYKLTIFGSGLYREVELSEYPGSKIKIGTTTACQVRFNREHFFDDFEMTLTGEAMMWTLSCTENIYFKTENLLKQYMLRLKHGDSVKVYYDSTGSELFSLEFLIDFERHSGQYDTWIDISGQNGFMLGGGEGCQIKILDTMLGHDYIYLSRSSGGYTAGTSGSRYGLYINGFKAEKLSVEIKEHDFFSLMGHPFYLAGGRLYTTKSKYIQSSFPVFPVNTPENALVYPRFKRSARQLYVLPDTCPEVLAPKTKKQPPKKNLMMTLIPAISSLVLMVALRGAMGGGMFVVYSAAMMALGAGMSVWTYKNDGKDYKIEQKEREEKYLAYIDEQEMKIAKLREKEAAVLKMQYLSAEEDEALIENFDSRLFEKRPSDGDFLEVYLGRGARPSVCQVKYKALEYKETEDELADIPQKLHDKYEWLYDAPITLPFTKAAVVGIVGTRTKLYQLLKNMVLDIAARHFYSDVKMFFIFKPQDKKLFEWLRWLKHTWRKDAGLRGFMYDEESEKAVLEFLYSELSFREQLSKEERKTLEYYVIFVYRQEALSSHPVSKYIENAADYHFIFIFFEEHKELLHQSCSRVIYLNNDAFEGYVYDCGNMENARAFQYTHISGEAAAKAALRLSPVYVDEISLESSLTKNISLFELLNIINTSDLDLKRRWASSKIYDSMAAPVGVKSGDEVVYLDLHEKSHGPHGLVAGTTGSGKSELLQTYILSMATLFAPYEVGFVIIDFKGGGMVNQFKGLPHLNGAITNIDGREIERSLKSIRAELKKRQELFAQYHVNHIDAYIRKYKSGETDRPLPHLILIVDEFAELKSDQPEFMKELISAARIGRSLGVHLILATQKPSGVVDNQIWSNSKFKLCLKVQNREDSMEVLKSPLASEIKEPGRAYLQVGNNEIFQLFQSAYSGAQAEFDSEGHQKTFKISKLALYGKREVIYEKKNRKQGGQKTQLEAMVSYINHYCKTAHIPKLPPICLPPLETRLSYPAKRTEDFAAGYTGAVLVPVGIYDDPDNQRQEEVFADFTQNHLFILGASQYGKTNMLQTLLKGLALYYTPEEVNIYILDFASMFLKNYETLAHVGGVVTGSEDEKLKNFMKMMTAEIKRRKEILLSKGISSFLAWREAGYTSLPQIVIMMDNMTAFRELFSQYEEAFLNICREGISVGISVTAANLQTSGIGYKYFSNFSQRFSLYCNDSSEYGYLFDHCRLVPKNTAGRALTEIDKVIYELQIYLAFEAEKEAERILQVRAFIQEMNERSGGMSAAKIPEIPKVLTEQYIKTQFMKQERKPYEFYAGINFSDTKLETMALNQTGVLGLSGRAHSGKTNFIKYIIDTLERGSEKELAELYIFDGIDKKLEEYKKSPSVKTYTLDAGETKQTVLLIASELEKRYNAMISGQQSIVDAAPLLALILQSRDSVAALSGDREAMEAYRRIVTKYKALKVFVLISDIENTAISFGSPEVLKLLKENKNLFIFEDLGEQKLHDVPLSTLREYAKPLEAGEAYRISGNSVSKIKTVLRIKK